MTFPLLDEENLPSLKCYSSSMALGRRSVENYSNLNRVREHCIYIVIGVIDSVQFSENR